MVIAQGAVLVEPTTIPLFLEDMLVRLKEGVAGLFSLRHKSGTSQTTPGSSLLGVVSDGIVG